MATIAEQLQQLNDIKSAIKTAISNRGVAVADTDTFRSYADKIGEIGETVNKTKYGASVDALLGDVDENGVLQTPSEPTVLNFAGVREIGYKGLIYKFHYYGGITSVDLSSLQSVGDQGMYHAFYGCKGITSVNLSSLQTVDSNGLYGAFYSCSGITSLDLSSLQSISRYGLNSAFNGCKNLTSLDLSSLQSVGDSGLNGAFGGCKGVTIVDLSSLQTVGSSGLFYTFRDCIGLTTISFPSLTSVQIYSLEYVFSGCTGITEIHFRADMQATIETLTGYADKWGATNATISFDLIGTITVDGVAYSRSEPDSIRVDGVKTFVAWKDSDGNIVYTDATAEPEVDTVVYSDQGTTQVGTVETVA